MYANMLISSRCSLLTRQFAQWCGHGKSYCVGVRRFMFEAWQFLLAHRARLPDTVDFVLYELFSIFAYICAQRSAVEYRHLISYTRSSKYCRLCTDQFETSTSPPRAYPGHLTVHRARRGGNLNVALEGWGI